MISPFQPLLQLVTIAVSPWGCPRAVDAQAGGGSASSRTAAPASSSLARTPVAVPLDRHSAEPTTLVSEYTSQDVPLWEPADRYRVLARDRQGTLWVTLNGVSRTLPPPPDRVHGPIGCDCQNFKGQRGSRYGSMQSRNLKVWMADHHDGNRPFAPYVPDLFCGLGPCYARTYRAELAQWDPDWVVPHADGVQITQEKRADFLALSRTDDAARKALRLDGRPDVPAPRFAETPEELHDQFGHWVAHRLETRGRILERLARDEHWREFQDKFHSLWVDMRCAGYFAHSPVGVWIQDTPAMVDKILELQRAGVPVYYRWRTDFNDSEKFPALAVLRPPREVEKPSTPRRTPAVNPAPAVSQAAREFTLPAKSVLWSPSRRAAQSANGARAAPSGDSFPRDAQPSAPSLAETESRRVQFEDNHARAEPSTTMADFDDEAFWDRANEFVDDQEKLLVAPPKLLARLSDPGQSSASGGSEGAGQSSRSNRKSANRRSVSPNAPYVLLSPPLTVRVENDKAYRSAVRDRVAVNMRINAVESVNKDAGTSSYRVIATDKAPRSFEERITVDPRHVKLRLFVLETEVAVDFVEEYVRQHPTATELELARFLLDRGMPFNLTFPLQGIDTTGQTFPSSSYEAFTITPGLSLPDSYSRWFEGGRAVLSVERVKRAAAARGGMLARIARLMGLETTFRRYPSAFVCSRGGPNLVGVDSKTGMFYYDDWITQDEIDILLGVVVTGDVTRSIMPPLEMFDTFYAGAWGLVYEKWFKARLGELDQSLRTGDPRGFFIAPNGWNKRFKGHAFA